MLNTTLLTLDIDWVPDFIIDMVSELLVSKRVKATWFVTHASPAVDRLRQQRELFELGIHPNFLPHSTHGSSADAVLRHCMTLVPEAVSMRTHSLMQSTPLLAQTLQQTPITIDSSMVLQYASHLQPVEFYFEGRKMTRVPFFWEDDLEMERPTPAWSLSPLLHIEGLKVFNFHPIHVYLNSSDMSAYRQVKADTPHLLDATPVVTDARIMPMSGGGSRYLFEQVVAHLASVETSMTLSELVSQYD